MRYLLLSVLLIGSLGTVIYYQAHVIESQRDLIRLMIKNPACEIPEGYGN